MEKKNIFGILKAIGLVGGIVCGALALAGDISEAKEAIDDVRRSRQPLLECDSSEEESE